MVANEGDNTGVGVVTLGDQLRRRRDAATASRPLRCGHRDPLTCLARRCHEKGPRADLSGHQLDGWGAAAAHLLELGHTPILSTDTLRALWRRGGTDRQLAQHLYNTRGAA
jgi:hypothetical protein